MIRNILYIILCFVLVSCYNVADKPHICPDLPTPTITVAELKTRIVGTHPHEIEHDVVVVGRVVSSDAEENFYRSMVVDDGTGAIEVMMGISPLAADYPEGLMVALCLEGCYVSYQRGVATAGTLAPTYESYDVGYLASRETIDRVVVRGGDVEVLEPRTMGIAELQRDDCGRLVRIDGLHLVDASSVGDDETIYDAQWAGYSLFKDGAGDSIAVYTRNYARFAEEHIPVEEVSLCGILEWSAYNGGKECYQLKMRYAKDCVAY